MRNHLADLIHKHLQGRTYRRLSRDCGGEPSIAALSKIINAPLKQMPTSSTIHGLSRGLNLSVREVVTACAETLGYDMGSGNDLWIHRGRELPEASQQVILAMSRELLAWNDGLYAEPNFLELAADQGEPNVSPDELPES